MPAVRPALRIFSLWALLASAAALAQTLPRGVERVTSVEGITEYRLDNGLQVLLFRDPSKATLTVNMTYLVGSAHESYGETGMAHLLEHLLFKGSKLYPNIMAELRDRGAQFNGSTSWDRTNYFETFDASDSNLDWALGLEADRMIHANVAQADLDSEMTVVRNELEAGENNPSRVLLQRVLSSAYVWHAYGKSPIGSRSDVENVPIERLQAFYKRHYQPDNAVLVIAGRFEDATALRLVAKHFARITQPSRTLEKPYTEEPTQDGEREVLVRRVGDIQLLIAAYHVPAGAHEDFVPLQFVTHALTNQPSGRLYKALVEPGLAAQVSAQTLQLRDPGMILFLAVVRQDASLDAARAAMLATLDDLASDPLTAEEIERARNQMLSGFERQMNNSQAIAVQLSAWASIGDWRLLFLDRDRVRETTVDAAQRAALHYLKASNRTIGSFVPGEPDRAEIPETPDVAALLDGYEGDQARAEGEQFDPSPTNIEQRTTRVDLPGGVTLLMLPKQTRGDAVHAVIRLSFGDAASLAGFGRVAGVTASMLMRGTQSRSRQEIQDELARRQSQLGVGGGGGTVGANLQTTRAELGTVLELAFDVLRAPSFPENELETLRAAMLAGLESSRSEPQAIAQRAFGRHFAQNYGPGDVRYVPTLDEEIELVRNLSIDQLREFHAQFYGASHAEVAIVGDFDPAEAQRLVAAGLDGWRSPKPFADVLTPYPDPPIEPVERVFETPDKENAFFLAGMPIQMSDAHPDFPALVLGNYVFGSGPSSRLFNRIRGREGLSYGVGSSFGAPAKSDGARFTVNAIAAPQNVARVEESFRDELASVLRDGYTDEELETAKESWWQGRQIGRSQDAGVANLLAGAAHDGRTLAWDAQLEERVRALDVGEVRDAMRRHLDLTQMTFIKSGDLASAAGGASAAVGAPPSAR